MQKFKIFSQMFKVFQQKPFQDRPLGSLPSVDSEFFECIGRLGGKSYGDGAYQVFDAVEVYEATNDVGRLFPEYEGSIAVFGCDWLGRFFATDARRMESGKPLMLMLETGAGEAMQIPVSISTFHNEEIVEYADDILALDFFRQWRSMSKKTINLAECMGYKIPLFLGGSDTVENLEIIDRRVYVELCAQLRNKTLTLNEGQSVGLIKIDNTQP